jgi:hypothetical protein
MMRAMKPFAVAAVLVACSSGAPPAQRPEPAPPPIVDAAPPDAGIPQAVLDAPAWVFHFQTAQRDETWTLRYAAGAALLVVDTAQGTTRYTGTATEGASLALALSTGTATLTLDCKPAKRAIGACSDLDAPPVDVLECYHPDFVAPMPFGVAPGVEYVVVPGCTGYRLAAPH